MSHKLYSVIVLKGVFGIERHLGSRHPQAVMVLYTFAFALDANVLRHHWADRD